MDSRIEEYKDGICHWEKQLTLVQKKLDKRSGEIYQVLGMYFIFEGVVLNILAQLSSKNSCRNWWIPVVVSLITSAVTLVSLVVKQNDCIKLMRKLKKRQDIINYYQNELEDLRRNTDPRRPRLIIRYDNPPNRCMLTILQEFLLPSTQMPKRPTHSEWAAFQYYITDVLKMSSLNIVIVTLTLLNNNSEKFHKMAEAPAPMKIRRNIFKEYREGIRHWEKQQKLVQKRLDSAINQIYQVLGMYFVFVGMVLNMVAHLASMTNSSTKWWIPSSVSLTTSAAALASLILKQNYCIKMMRKLKKREYIVHCYQALVEDMKRNPRRSRKNIFYCNPPNRSISKIGLEFLLQNYMNRIPRSPTREEWAEFQYFVLNCALAAFGVWVSLISRDLMCR
ncbi:hypothetical protein SELMODRAFT_415821 [Selaginella moellendorffii]|uniref:Uncharacterized protein n=1 Tax=Selaginella moellendorffii TaxID=88036 RepID=D8RXC3_SELML|nr:hypothetical protein SELMODRAFT_415821 [Selaginella moellendorffii]